MLNRLGAASFFQKTILEILLRCVWLAVAAIHEQSVRSGYKGTSAPISFLAIHRVRRVYSSTLEVICFGLDTLFGGP